MISTTKINQAGPVVQVQPKSPTQNVVTELLGTNLSSRIIPKIGSIVKRFSLNYSGEGLVTDPQRVRTVRVGIRFQVQVDSFLNNRQQQTINNNSAGNRPRGITRTNSAPHSIEYANNPIYNICDHTNSACGGNPTTENRNLQAIEYPSSDQSTNTGSSPIGLRRSFNSLGNLKDHNQNQSDFELDSSSGVSSLAGSNPQSPVASRRHSSSALTFHNRINQALTLCRNQLAAATGNNSRRDNRGFLQRRSSVQVLRRGSVTPDSCGSLSSSPSSALSSPACNMEDSSSYQVLRCFPGSNVNSVRELSWETAAFEKDVRDRVQWLGSKFSSLRIPPFVQNLLSSMKEYAVENPISAVLILTLAIACSLPISIFLGFAVATILFSFLGFLIVEGTLLTAATFGFGSIIIVLGLITLGIVLIGSLGYITTSQIYSIFTGGPRPNLSNIMQKIPFIGDFFKSAPKASESSLLPKIGNGKPYKMSNGYGPLTMDLEDTSEEDEQEYEDEEEDDEDEENMEILNKKDENETEAMVSDESSSSNSDSVDDVSNTPSPILLEQEIDNEEDEDDIVNKKSFNGEGTENSETQFVAQITSN